LKCLRILVLLNFKISLACFSAVTVSSYLPSAFTSREQGCASSDWGRNKTAFQVECKTWF